MSMAEFYAAAGADDYDPELLYGDDRCPCGGSHDARDHRGPNAWASRPRPAVRLAHGVCEDCDRPSVVSPCHSCSTAPDVDTSRVRSILVKERR